MKYLLIISLLVLNFSFQSVNYNANMEQLEVETRIEKNIKTSFWVNGVCEMCQARIQKAALKTKGVKMAKWNIETKILSVIYSDKKCSVDDIKKNLAKAGHDTVEFKATDTAYENLHGCCHYDRNDVP